jgi:hypothetical protein
MPHDEYAFALRACDLYAREHDEQHLVDALLARKAVRLFDRGVVLAWWLLMTHRHGIRGPWSRECGKR